MQAFRTRHRGDASTGSTSAHALSPAAEIPRRRAAAGRGAAVRPDEIGEEDDDDDVRSAGGSSDVTAHPTTATAPSAHALRREQPPAAGRSSSRAAGKRNGSVAGASEPSYGTRTPTHSDGRSYATSDEYEYDDDDGAGSVASSSTSSGGRSSRQTRQSELGTWHYLPLLFVVLPVIAGALVGRGEAWRDLLVLGLVGYWVYWLIKTPWELYHASLHHSLLSSEGSPLSKDHLLYLALTVLSPLLGAFLLTLTRSTLTYIPSYLSPSSIRLFLLAALIKPVTNVVGLLQDRTAHLKAAVSAPKHDEAELLRRRLKGLEREVRVLRSEAASRRDVATLRDDVYGAPGGLAELGRTVKRVERRAELSRLTLGERVELVQRGLLGLREEVEDERERQGYAFGQWILQLLRLSSGGGGGGEGRQLGGPAGRKGAFLYSPAGLLTPRAHNERAVGTDPAAAAARLQASALPPSWSPPSSSSTSAQRGSVVRALVHQALATAGALAKAGVRLVFWPLVLGRWAAGQLLEVVRVG